MKNKQNQKSKKQCPVGSLFRKVIKAPFLRMVLFVAAVGVIFFSIGNVIWQTKHLVDSGIEAEQNEHVSKIEAKIFEIEAEINFFEKFLDEAENGKIMNMEEKRELNSHIRKFSGQIADLERYYLDQRFDNSLDFLNFGKKKNDDFEQIKKLIRDGELFLENMAYLSLSSQANAGALDLTQYNFKIFKEKYQEAVKAFCLE